MSESRAIPVASGDTLNLSQDVIDEIQEIMAASGAPNLVVQWRDGEQNSSGWAALSIEKMGRDSYKVTQGKYNTETVFAICSLSKAFTAAALSHFLGKNYRACDPETGCPRPDATAMRFSWSSKVLTLVPELAKLLKQAQHDIKDKKDHSRRFERWQKLEVHHLLTHTSGLVRGDYIWYGSNNELRLSDKDSLEYLATRDFFDDPGAPHAYNNDGWMMAGHILERLIQDTIEDDKAQAVTESNPRTLLFREYMQEHIFDPLGLDRTSLEPPSNWQPRDRVNIAASHSATMPCSEAVPVGPMTAGKRGFASASSSVHSCTRDVMAWLKAWCDAYRGGNSTESQPLFSTVRAAELMRGRVHGEDKSVPVRNPPDAANVGRYAFGWVHITLPGKVGFVGYNAAATSVVLPDLLGGSGGGDGEGIELFYHQGGFVGSLAAAFMVPDRDIQIVALCDSFARSDVPDFVCQMVLQELLRHRLRDGQGNKYLPLAKQVIKDGDEAAWIWAREISRRRATTASSTASKQAGQSLRYDGVYWMMPFIGSAVGARLFKITVCSAWGSLWVNFSGRHVEDERFFRLEAWDGKHDGPLKSFDWAGGILSRESSRRLACGVPPRTPDVVTRPQAEDFIKLGLEFEPRVDFYRLGFGKIANARFTELYWDHRMGVSDDSAWKPVVYTREP